MCMTQLLHLPQDSWLPGQATYLVFPVSPVVRTVHLCRQVSSTTVEESKHCRERKEAGRDSAPFREVTGRDNLCGRADPRLSQPSHYYVAGQIRSRSASRARKYCTRILYYIALPVLWPRTTVRGCFFVVKWRSLCSFSTAF